jgi:hypothetical protein
VSHGDRPIARVGRPNPAGKGAGSSGLFGALRQGGRGNFSTSPSFSGGGNGAAFPQCSGQDNLAASGFASNAGFGFNAGPQGSQLQQFQGGNGNSAFPQSS